ncbi:baseplate J/gp47 family protein [Enterobacter mori]|uniref:baseplate J/gp47 family protein n=1 Tax=Enterobacter mori TaxID=539813 RepID=UPI003B8423B3
MPFPVPTIEESTARQLRDIGNALPNEDIDTGTDSDYGVRAAAVSGVADGLYAHQAWIIRQIFPDTADPEFLELHCRQRNVLRKQATSSTGTAAITGTAGKTLPSGSDIRGDGVSVTTTEDCLIAEDGTATAPVISTDTGEKTNTDAPLAATLVSPPEGINSSVTVNPLAGGTDKETDDSLLARYLEILRMPPAGGNKHDYKRWALEVDGVSMAYVAPLRRGLGTADVAITSADDLPTQELIDTVLAHIEGVRPVTADNTLVLAPDEKLVDFLIRITVSGVSFEQATLMVQQVVIDFMNRLEPGKKLTVSQLESQISFIPGIIDRKIITPAENVPAIIDATTWEWLRPGVITVEPLP